MQYCKLGGLLGVIQYTEENIKSSKHILWKRQRVFNNQLTTDNYQDSLIFDARLFKNKLIQIINEHPSNAIKYTVMACIDPKHWETIKTASTLNGGSTVTLDHNNITNLNSPWAYIKIQIKIIFLEQQIFYNCLFSMAKHLINAFN